MSDTSSFDIGSVIDDAKKVIVDPFGFYQDLKLEGGLTNPILFVVCMGLVMGAMAFVGGIVGLGLTGGIGAGLAALIFMPIMMVIGSFIFGAIMFVLWKLMGSDKNFEAAYRCVAYASAIAPVAALLSVIPYIGTLIRVLWTGLLLYAASINSMGIKDQTAKIAIGILTAIFALVGLNGERHARNIESKFGKYAESIDADELGKRMEDMSAEEAGEMMGEFLKGLEKAAKDAQQE
ncbi:MAG: Yip1 family protein [Pseudomonadota bacterium]